MTGDDPSNGCDGCVIKIQGASEAVPSTGSAGCIDIDIDTESSNQRWPRRSRAASAKVRENREVELEAKATKAAAARQKRPPLKAITNLPAASISVDDAKASDCLSSTPTCTAPADPDGISDLVRSLSLNDDAADDDYGDDSDGSVAGSIQYSSPVRVASIADHFKQSDRQEAERRCDFNSHDSINLWFPKYKSKGYINCPLALIKTAHTNKARVSIVWEWRNLTIAQQRIRVKELCDGQQRERKGARMQQS